MFSTFGLDAYRIYAEFRDGMGSGVSELGFWSGTGTTCLWVSVSMVWVGLKVGTIHGLPLLPSGVLLACY